MMKTRLEKVSFVVFEHTIQHGCTVLHCRAVNLDTNPPKPECEACSIELRMKIDALKKEASW
jgi:hypothetical protein